MIQFAEHSTRQGEWAAVDTAHVFVVRQRDTDDQRPWMVSIWGLTGEGDTARFNDHIGTTAVETRSLAFGVCQAFAALGEPYNAAEHGYHSRLTVATAMAYDDDRTLRSPDVQAGLEAMRRGEVTEA